MLAPALRESLANHYPTAKSIYDFKRVLNIRGGTEHCSSDDVDLIRSNIYIERITAHPLPEEVYDRPIHNPDRDRKQHIQAAKHTYVIDKSKNIVHSFGCPKINEKQKTEIVHTLKKCLKNSLRPCACCREEFWQFVENNANKSIDSCHYSFVYSDTGLFHKTNCPHVFHIPNIQGCVRYETAVNHGYRPCGWCKPKPEDEIEPLHIYNYGRELSCENSPYGDNKSGSPEERKRRAQAGKATAFSATRRLNAAEVRALIRQRQAAEERAALPNNLTGQSDRDAHILTQSTYVFWAAKGYSTFHLRCCPKLSRLSGFSGFSTFAAAMKSGYSPCKICRPSAMNDITVSVPIYQQQRSTENVCDIDRKCDALNWEHIATEKEYCIVTPVGKWRIKMNTSPVDVYHINKAISPDNETNYHKQHRLFLSITDTFEYIKRHDLQLIERVANNLPDEILEYDLPEIE